jgi:hypothetical protein
MRQNPLQNGSGFCAVHFGHRQVEEDQVRRSFLGFLNSLNAVFGISADSEPVIAFYHRPKQRTDRWIVVYDEDSLFGHRPGPKKRKVATRTETIEYSDCCICWNDQREEMRVSSFATATVW